MRRVLSVLALVLAACGGNGGGFDATPEPVQHVPEISDLKLSPDSALYMEGDGSVVVTAEITFRDVGRDIQTLCIGMPDSTIIEFDELIATETGTFTEDFTMSTETIGAFTLEFWLVDKAGDSSDHRFEDFSISGNAQSSDWTRRLSGLPYVLNDVIWDGAVFIAVGDEGAVLTSTDGVDWMERESNTDADLYAVASYGPDIFAVGDEIVSLSTDHGETWITKSEPGEVSLHAVAVDSSQVVVGGSTGFFILTSTGYFGPIVMVSEDRGETWQVIESWPEQNIAFSDLIARDGFFIAVAGIFHFTRDEGWAFVSSDGTLWNDIFRDPESGFITVVDDGSRFTIGGSNGTVITSIDGLNWTEMQTPFEGIDYSSGAWDGTSLVLAGGYTCRPQAGGGFDCSAPQTELPLGISSTDGGVTWDTFNIDGEFRSLGMAFGNGRFVSVGVSEWRPDEGAIYTAD